MCGWSGGQRGDVREGSVAVHGAALRIELYAFMDFGIVPRRVLLFRLHTFRMNSWDLSFRTAHFILYFQAFA